MTGTGVDNFEYYPQGVPRSLDYPDISVYQLLERSEGKYPDNTATIFMGGKMTFRQLKNKVDRFAAALHHIGIKKGDRVVIMLPNCPQAVISYYAVLRLGAVAVMTNPLYMERELSHQLRDADSETIIFLDLLYPKINKVKDDTPLKNFIVTGIKDFLPFPLNLIYPFKAKKDGQWVDIPAGQGITGFKSLIDKYPPNPPAVDINPKEDLALLQYTGGTTGLSKGAMLTHGNLVANVMQVSAWWPEVRQGKEILLAALPFFHVYGMTVAMNFCVYNAAAMILVPRFEINNVLKLIQKYRATLFPGAPTMYVAVNSHPEIKKYDLSSIRLCLSGAAPLPVEVRDKFEEITGGRLLEGYGLTETSPVTHSNPVNDQRYVGSIGFPLPDTRCKLVDIETGQDEVGPGQPGELCIYGPQVMKGYWNMPEETAKCLQNGWLHTGDIAQVDDKGLYYIVDRKKDLVIAGGYNIYPREVEEVLYEHPKVKEAVVAGVPDKYRGETLKAYIILKDNETASDQEIIKFCQERLAKYKVPKKIEFRQELPKTMVGKILRRVLVEEERKATSE
ncbi:long-chain-fatty-acid--CoA ligase [Desulfocucumis palustris]|uniref:Long-chain-fatty-acid--CoA ligase n=1 Tax=Desulfocucumis palustris TaxID=1898651 RepID=A0A2L2XBJ2_9FIRM|nr:long-chain fatty acid--CoA ligase [Desulfocucumis palustris]GBF33053.1 long-chain-fatty-acid--CoA ligase [Desulfocucumis palustris]